jgi:beta-glucosidase/6-phospho-beta-glucosidase/beta-galactosidase
MNGTADFLSVDTYTATVIAPPKAGKKESVMQCAKDILSSYRPSCVNQTTVDIYGWDIGYRSQTYVYIRPTYLWSYLKYLYNTWRTPVAITEFGFPVYGEADKDLQDQLSDTPRVCTI